MFYIQLFGEAFEGEEQSFDLAATRPYTSEAAIVGTNALAERARFPFDRAQGYRLVCGTAHMPVLEALFAKA